MKKNETQKTDFWQFSLDFYKDKDVKNTCLILQNEYQFQVNIILFLLWYSASYHKMLSKEQIQELMLIVEQKVLLTDEFRSFRRDFWQKLNKAGEPLPSESIKQALVDVEISLEAEIQSTIIEHMASELQDNHAKSSTHSNYIELDFIASENLERYFYLIHPGTHDQNIWTALQILVSHLAIMLDNDSAA